MSFFRRLFGMDKKSDGSAAGKVADAANEGADALHTIDAPNPPRASPRGILERLDAAIRAARDDEVLTILDESRLTVDEGRVVAHLAALRDTLSERVLLRTAVVLRDRGGTEQALELLSSVRSSAGLILRCDLLEQMGAYAEALAVCERVLLRNLDELGAKERNVRLRARLGRAVVERPAARASETIAKPKVEGPYRIQRETGRGGAAVVYAATDLALGRTVALKAYHDPIRQRPQLLAEARTAVALSGPNVIRVFDVDPVEGWIALEWCEGGSLRDATGPAARCSTARIAEIARGLAAALAHIHKKGWVHHDVKPANVLLSGDRVVLADFGIAATLGAAPPDGSLGFVSPERLMGRPSDPRDDVYGFGRVLEELLRPSDELDPRLFSLMQACVGEDSRRPVDGAALVSLLSSAA